MEATPNSSRIAAAISEFFFRPHSAYPLVFLRIGIGCVLLLQAFSIAPDFKELFGDQGIVQGKIVDYLGDPLLPKLETLWALPAYLGMGQELPSFWGIFYFICVTLMLVGLKTNFFAFGAWLTHLMLFSRGSATNYGADHFAHIALFYLMLMPCGRALSIDNLLSGNRLPLVSAWAAFTLRSFQLHLCIAYFASGLEKLAGPQWQNGDVIWRALSLPVYQQYDLTWLVYFPWLTKLLAWSTLVIEIGYPVFIWLKPTQKWWVVAVSLLHLGIGLFLGLWIFALIMIVLTLSAFGFSAARSANASQRLKLRWALTASV